MEERVMDRSKNSEEYCKEFRQLYLDEQFNIKQEIHDAVLKTEWIPGEYGAVDRWPLDYEPYHHIYNYKKGQKQTRDDEMVDIFPNAIKFIEIRRQKDIPSFKYLVNVNKV